MAGAHQHPPSLATSGRRGPARTKSPAPLLRWQSARTVLLRSSAEMPVLTRGDIDHHGKGVRAGASFAATMDEMQALGLLGDSGAQTMPEVLRIDEGHSSPACTAKPRRNRSPSFSRSSSW